MTQIEFFVTMKVTCEHDKQGYWGDLTLAHVKQSAIGLIQPNFHTVENGVKLKKVEVEFHSDDDINNDNWDFCPDETVEQFVGDDDLIGEGYEIKDFDIEVINN